VTTKPYLTPILLRFDLSQESAYPTGKNARVFFPDGIEDTHLYKSVAEP
jgi:hypothetical protein